MNIKVFIGFLLAVCVLAPINAQMQVPALTSLSSLISSESRYMPDRTSLIASAQSAYSRISSEVYAHQASSGIGGLGSSSASSTPAPSSSGNGGASTASEAASNTASGAGATSSTTGSNNRSAAGLSIFSGITTATTLQVAAWIAMLGVGFAAMI